MYVYFKHKIIRFFEILKTIIFVEYFIGYIWTQLKIFKPCVRKLKLIINSLATNKKLKFNITI